MNLMHSNLSITDGVYGVLSTADVGQRIAVLGRQPSTGQVLPLDLVDQLIVIALQLKGGSNR